MNSRMLAGCLGPSFFKRMTGLDFNEKNLDPKEVPEGVSECEVRCLVKAYAKCVSDEEYFKADSEYHEAALKMALTIYALNSLGYVGDSSREKNGLRKRDNAELVKIVIELLHHR